MQREVKGFFVIDLTKKEIKQLLTTTLMCFQGYHMRLPLSTAARESCNGASAREMQQHRLP